jgi:hypothetical protein
MEHLAIEGLDKIISELDGPGLKAGTIRYSRVEHEVAVGRARLVQGSSLFASAMMAESSVCVRWISAWASADISSAFACAAACGSGNTLSMILPNSLSFSGMGFLSDF